MGRSVELRNRPNGRSGDVHLMNKDGNLPDTRMIGRAQQRALVRMASFEFQRRYATFNPAVAVRSRRLVSAVFDLPLTSEAIMRKLLMDHSLKPTNLYRRVPVLFSRHGNPKLYFESTLTSAVRRLLSFAPSLS